MLRGVEKTAFLPVFIGGLFAFFFGMRLMVYGLHSASGLKVRSMLLHAMDRSWKGILAGAGVTVMVQSSSLVTALIVGFVESGICGLLQGIYVTMGANLGTTLVPQVLATRMPPFEWALIVAAMVLCIFGRRQYAAVAGGAGMLIGSAKLMIFGAAPLAKTAAFRAMMAWSLTSPLNAIILGVLAAAALQSSGLVVTMMVALARAGVIPPLMAIAVALGSNIGTCATSLIAAIGTGRAARSVALFHLGYNAGGVALIYPFLGLFAHWMSLLSQDISRQVANAHLMFNFLSIIAFWPVVAVVAARMGKAEAARQSPANEKREAGM